MAMARTTTAFLLCRVASANPMAISTVLAMAATGGVQVRQCPLLTTTLPTAGSWATTASMTTGTTARRAVCTVFVV